MEPNDPHDEQSPDPHDEQSHKPPAERSSEQLCEQYAFDPSTEWQAELARQIKQPRLFERLTKFAVERLRGFGPGHAVDLDQARELVAAAAHDTARGRVTWNPERRDLETHLKNVIVRRAWLDWRHAERFPHDSIDAQADDDGRSSTLDEMESMMAERTEDPESAERARLALHDLKDLARSDPDLLVYIDARADKLHGVRLQRATGLSPERARSARRRLEQIRKQLSFTVRPRRRKRGK